MAIRRDHYPIEVNALLAEIEVDVTTSPTRSESDVCLLQPVAYKTSLKDIGAWLQTLEAKRPRSICAGTDSRPLNEDLDCSCVEASTTVPTMLPSWLACCA